MCFILNETKYLKNQITTTAVDPKHLKVKNKE